MREFNKRKNGEIFILLILAFGIIITSINLNLLNINSEETILDNKTDENGIILDNKDRIEHQNEMPQTADQTFNNIHIISKNDTLIRKDGLDQSILFYFNDSNGTPISDLTNDNITVKDNQTESGNFTIRNGGQGDHNWTLYDIGGSGYYKLNVSIKGLNSGWVRLELNASYSTNWSISYINFYLRGNSTSIIITGMLDPANKVSWYKSFIGSNLTLELYMTDDDYSDNVVLDEGHQAIYLISYIENFGGKKNGTLSNNIEYDKSSETYGGAIGTEALSKIGNYKINLTINLLNYEIKTYSFDLIITPKYLAQITIISKPTEIIAGETFDILILAQYKIGSDFYFIEGGSINITIYDNDKISFTRSVSTDNNGTAGSFFTIPIYTKNLILDVDMESGYYHESYSIKNIEIKIISFLEYLLLSILYIGVAIGIIIYSITVYQDKILPKKHKKARFLKEINIKYENVINLEKIFVLYKRTGMCIFFKSFELNKIDLKQINELISAISSFGKELASQEKINEITYDNKILLLTDGDFIRVALVLGNKPSISLCNYLDTFLDTFEKKYDRDLLNWRYELNLFKNAEQIVDEILNTSIILPHEINQETSSLKNLQNKYSKEILEIARELEKDNIKKFFFISTLIEDATSKNRNDIVKFLINIKDRKFFYIETLIKEAINKIGKNIADIFIGIKELKEKKYLTPIKIYTLNTRSISQQERSLINQKVSELTQFTSEEIKKIMNDLMQKNLMEREVYFTCLLKQHKIISPPIKSKVEDIKISIIKK